jgi:hypothetical protein
MSNEENQVITIDNLSYNISDLSDTCKEKLGATQQTNQAIGLLVALINAAKAGNDADFKEAVKLLPDAIAPQEEVEGELAH